MKFPDGFTVGLLVSVCYVDSVARDVAPTLKIIFLLPQFWFLAEILNEDIQSFQRPFTTDFIDLPGQAKQGESSCRDESCIRIPFFGVG